jgi:hypothetical protein
MTTKDFYQSLESLFRSRFHIVPTRTNRQDQWYKRNYQAWKAENGDCEPLILSPKDSKELWAQELQELAANFAVTVQQCATEVAEHQRTLNSPSENKLFNDSVLEGPLTILKPEYLDKRPLTPVMQRLSYWTTLSRINYNDREQHSKAIKALLECEEINVLLYLAQHPLAQIKTAATLKIPGSNQYHSLDIGWVSIANEALETLVFLVILKCFPEALLVRSGYRKWIPFALVPDSIRCSGTSVIRFMDIFSQQRPGVAMKEEEMQHYIEWCFRVVTTTQVLSQACKLPELDWGRRMVDTFLYFVGFEAWNRERQGVGYLNCDLNTTKNEAWLRKTSGLQEKQERVETIPVSKQTKPRDPLLLHEAKKCHKPEPTEEENAMLEKLAGLEVEEAVYGRKRSTKYRRASPAP